MGESLKFVLEMDDKMSGPAGDATKAIGAFNKGLGDTLGEMGAIVGPIYKAELALIGLGAAAIIGGAALAIHAAEAKQDTIDMLDAMMGSQEAAVDTYKQISGLGDTLAISLDRGSELARELSAAGVTNKEQLVAAIKSIGEVESVLGKGAGGKIQNLIEKSQQTGVFKISAKQLTGTGVDEGLLAQKLGVTKKQLEAGQVNAERGIAALTGLLDEKFGKVAEKQALDIGNQFTRLKDNISKLFEDVDTGPFLDAFSQIVKVFDQSTTSGKALKFMITTFFDGLFKLVAKVAPYVTTFLKGLVIIGLKAYIALKPLGKAFGDIGDQSSGIDKLASFMSGLGTAIAWVITQVVDAVLWFQKIGSAFLDVEGFLISLPGKFYDAGASIIGGLIQGIQDGASKVVESVGGIAQSALDKFTGIFGIHSDSKVMSKMGGHLMGGLSAGIAANDNVPQKAMGKVLGGDDASPVGPAASGSATPSGGSTSVTIGPGAIVISINGSNASEISAQLKEVLPGELASMFESLGLSVGAA